MYIKNISSLSILNTGLRPVVKTPKKTNTAKPFLSSFSLPTTYIIIKLYLRPPQRASLFLLLSSLRSSASRRAAPSFVRGMHLPAMFSSTSSPSSPPPPSVRQSNYSLFGLISRLFRRKPADEQRPRPRRRESRRERRSRVKSNRTALIVHQAAGDDPFTSFHLDIWMNVSRYLRCGDVMNLRLASLGVPRAITLNPALTSHLTLNLDQCPWYDWVRKKRVDHDHLARMWCRRAGVIDFPRDITNSELEIFLSRGYLGGATRVSFGRCQNLTVDWLELLHELRHLDIEVGLPSSITDDELSRYIPFLQHVRRLNCVGCSHLTDDGFNLLGKLRDLKELYFLHW
jgi:hypothetical protein